MLIAAAFAVQLARAGALRAPKPVEVSSHDRVACVKMPLLYNLRGLVRPGLESLLRCLPKRVACMKIANHRHTGAGP